MKKTYWTKLLEIAQEAEKELMELLPNGTTLRLIPEDIDVDDVVAMSEFSLPVHETVTKHGHFLQFEIFEISRNDNHQSIVVKGIENGENGEDGEFFINELNIEETCALVDHIKSLPK